MAAPRAGPLVLGLLVAAAAAFVILRGREGGPPPSSPPPVAEVQAPRAPDPPPSRPPEVPESPSPPVGEPSVALEGIVLDARTGRPVEGARVRVLSAEPIDAGREMTLYAYPGIESEARTWGEALTGADGRFRIGGIPPGTPQLVVAQAAGAAGRVPLTAPLVGKSQPLLEVRIDRTGRLFGRVTPRNPGVLVAAAPGTDPAALAGVLDGACLQDTRFNGASTRIVRADPEGGWAIEGLELGVPWAVVARGAEAPSLPETDLLLTDAAPERRVDLRLRAWGRVSIRVLRPDGTPAPDASAGVDGWRGSGSGDPATGRWTYAAVVPGRRRAWAQAPGFEGDSAEVEVREGEAVEVTIHLRPGVPVEGVLVDGEGRPVAGAKVGAFWVGEGDAFGLMASADTDAEGRFRCEGLGRSTHRFEAEHGGAIALEAVAVREGMPPLRLVLRAAGGLRITVRDADGDLVERAWVDARGPVYRCGWTEAAGTCDLVLPPGVYRAGFTHGEGPAAFRVPVEVRPGETAEVELRVR